MNRREFVRTALSIGAGVSLSPLAAGKQGRGKPLDRIIDVHSHYFSPHLLKQWTARAEVGDYILPSVRNWSISALLEQLDLHSIHTAMLSCVSRPFMLKLATPDLRALVRESNEFAARLIQDHPNRLGQFVVLPLPDVEGSLREVEYGLEVLKADGISLMTSYADRWPGDPQFAELLQELDRRRAVVFCHPHAPACCANLMPHVSTAEAGLIEFPFDTGRAVMSLLLSGSLARFPRIRWIFCHAGGPIPVLAGRIRTSAPQLVPNLETIAPKGVDHELQRLYYDTANSAYQPTLGALLDYVPLSQVLFGSDFPYVGIDRNLLDFERVQLDHGQQQAIAHENARNLFSRLTK